MMWKSFNKIPEPNIKILVAFENNTSEILNSNFVLHEVSCSRDNEIVNLPRYNNHYPRMIYWLAIPPLPNVFDYRDIIVEMIEPSICSDHPEQIETLKLTHCPSNISIVATQYAEGIEKLKQLVIDKMK